MAKGDSVTLKDGSQITGEILSTGPEGVLIEYHVTSTIKDQKMVPQDQILKILSVPADEKAFLALGSLVSPPTVLDTSFYDLMIDKKIPEFLSQYPYSRHLSEIRDDLRLFESERARIRQGDRRINGGWIAVAQIAADPYQFGGKINLVEMQELVKRNDTVGSLKSYELLEKNYPGSDVMPDAIAIALKQMDSLQGSLSQAEANFIVTDKNRQNALAHSSADQVKDLKDAIRNENLAAKTAMDAANNDGTKFFPIFPNNKEAMDALQALIVSENTRLSLLQKTPMKEGISAATECTRLISIGNLKEAQNQLAIAQKLWPACAAIKKLQQQIDSLLKAESAEAKKPGQASPNHNAKP